MRLALWQNHFALSLSPRPLIDYKWVFTAPLRKLKAEGMNNDCPATRLTFSGWCCKVASSHLWFMR